MWEYIYWNKSNYGFQHKNMDESSQYIKCQWLKSKCHKGEIERQQKWEAIQISDVDKNDEIVLQKPIISSPPQAVTSLCLSVFFLPCSTLPWV